MKTNTYHGTSHHQENTEMDTLAKGISAKISTINKMYCNDSVAGTAKICATETETKPNTETMKPNNMATGTINKIIIFTRTETIEKSPI